MPFYVLPGELMNAVARAASDPTASPTAASAYPTSALGDNRSSIPMIFGTAADDQTISFDLNLLTNGSFETNTSGWTLHGTGTMTQSNTHAKDGTYALKLEGLDTLCKAYQDVAVRPGEELRFIGSAWGPDAYIRIRNRQTGNYLSTSATWGASDDYVLQASSAAWADQGGLTFTVEDYDNTLREDATLRIMLDSQDTAGNWFDKISLFPTNDWVSVHGHNLSPFVVPTIQTSDDNSAWTTRATMTIYRDSFYYKLSSYTHRYWRLLFDGRPDTGSLIGLGEVVIGFADTLDVNPLYPGALGMNERQTRLETADGSQFIYLHNGQPQRSLQMSFAYRNQAAYIQSHRELFRGSRGGANLICIAPVEMDETVVILGRIQETASFTKITDDSRTAEYEVVEDALPNLVMTHAYDAPIDEQV